MTDRLKGVYVVFDQDIREDDAEAILNAIRMVRHVQSVEPIVANIEDHFARDRVRRELGQKILDILYPKKET